LFYNPQPTVEEPVAKDGTILGEQTGGKKIKNTSQDWKLITRFVRFFRRSKASVPIPTPPSTGTRFSDPFQTNNRIEEAGSINESANPNWWVNSGAWLIAANGVGKTVQGDLGTLDKWRLDYALSNPDDTDNGYHPQNIFRLVQRSNWKNITQQAYYRINQLNLSESVNRNGSNGLFLLNRYVDGNNLYYTGVRVDGAAVIKKKYKGVYYTLDYRSIFSGSAYDSDSNPNVLPMRTWIGLRSVVQTNPDGTVTIQLYLDRGRTGNWALVAQAVDNGAKYGGAVIKSAAHGGIRTDFMDVEFEDYQITENP
jgi:hypothetical protein